MARAIVPITAVYLLLAACNAPGSADQAGSSNEAGDAAGDTAGGEKKSVTAQVSGDRTTEIKAVGELAGAGMLPGDSKTLVTITATRDDGDDKGVVVSVMVGAPSIAALTQNGATIDTGVGTVSFKPADGKTDFSTMFYPQFYATDPKSAGKGATVHFDKLTKLSSENHIARYRVVGSFEFKAAARPEPVSDACTLEAIKAAPTQRNPSFNATLCGAQQVTVRGRFDSVENVLEK